MTRKDRQEVAATVWRDLGAIENDMVRREFLAVTGAIGVGEVTAPKTLRHTFVTTLQDANVDPLIRNELMGHVPAGISLPGAGLAMTAVYTHTRPETKRRQLEEALSGRAVIAFAEQWLERNSAESIPVVAAGAMRPEFLKKSRHNP